jgi:hypothetical protein
MYLRDNGKVRIVRFQNGSTSELGSGAIDTFITIEPGTWLTIRLGVQTLEAYFDNHPTNPVFTITDASIAAGGIVLGARRALVAFDDVTVTLYARGGSADVRAHHRRRRSLYGRGRALHQRQQPRGILRVLAA